MRYALFYFLLLDDAGTLQAIKIAMRTGYMLDPHGLWPGKPGMICVGGMEALCVGGFDHTKPGLTKIFLHGHKIIENKAVGVLLETAHPAKFGDIVQSAIGREPVMPDRLEKVLYLPNTALSMENNYEVFKSWLLENL